MCVSRQSSLSWWKTWNWLGRQCCFPVVWSVLHYKRQNFKNIKTLEYLKATKVMTSPTLNQILVEKIIMTNPLSLEEKKFWFLPLLWSFWLFLAVCTPFWSLDKDAVPGFLFFWGPPEKSEDFYQDFIFNTWWLKDFRKKVSIHSDAKLYDPLQEGGLDMEQSGAGGQEVTATSGTQRRLCLSPFSWPEALLFFWAPASSWWAGSREALGWHSLEKGTGFSLELSWDRSVVFSYKFWQFWLPVISQRTSLQVKI